MPEHLSPDEIDGYGGRNLPLEKLLEADRHLATCVPCRQRLQVSKLTPAVPALVTAVTHPTYDEMSAFWDDRLGNLEYEAIGGHTRICSMCRDELDDLQQFDRAIGASPAGATNQLAAVRITEVDAGPVATFWERMRAFFRAPNLGLTAAAALMVAGIGLTLAQPNPDFGSRGSMAAASKDIATSIGPLSLAGFFFLALVVAAFLLIRSSTNK